MKIVNGKSKKVWLNYTGLVLLIMGPMLLRGYILTFDMVFTPKLPAPSTVINSYLFEEFLHILNIALPSQLIQKMMIFSILLIAGVGMHKLTQLSMQKRKELPAYFAGILYVVNPFTYERWMAGHYYLLVGYALLPWLVRSLLFFVKKPARRQAFYLMIWYCAMAFASIHVLVLSILAGIVILVVHTILNRNKIYFQKLGLNTLLICLGFVLINSFWIVGVVNGSSEIVRTVNSFDNRHLEAFTTAANPHVGLLPNVIGMSGFWLERYHRYALPNAVWVMWLTIMLALLVLVGLGIKRHYANSRAQTIAFAIIGGLGFFIASGIHAPIWGRLNHWILLHIPILRGFREPQKFVALLVLAYCFFAAIGIEQLMEFLDGKKFALKDSLAPALLLLPIGLVPVMIFGFAGQLKPVDYPASWYRYNKQLKQDTGDYKALFLPWHEYMSFDFTPRIIANPAPNFFGSRIISGDNAEFGDVYRETFNPRSDYIEQQTLPQLSAPDLGLRLNKLNIKYIMLSRGYDWQNYRQLDNTRQLKKIRDDVGLTVYENTENRK